MGRRKNNMPTDGKHDTGYRLLFSQPEMVRDLIRGYLAEEWIRWLDLDTLERLEECNREPALEPLNEIIVWRLRWQGGSSWVHLILKAQMEKDPAMALRMGLYRELHYHELLRRRATAPLPVVLPLVLYCGAGRWQAPRDSLELFLPLLPALQRHAPRTRYLLVDTAHDPVSDKAGADNLVSLLCKLERSRTPDAVDGLLERLVALLSEAGNEALRQAWSDFLGRSFLPRRFPDLFTPERAEAWALEV